jgi:hypothetical protein
MSYSLLGAHVNSTVSGVPEAIKEWKPPLVVLLDHSDVWHGVKAESPHTVFVGRVYMEFEPDFNRPDLDPIKAARDHCDRILPWAERMGGTYSFWQGVNEPVIGSPEAMQRCAAFDGERTRIMDDHGFRVVVGSFSVGNPRLAYWQEFLPALEAARQYQGALALHQYAWPTMDHKAPWYSLRHRKVYQGEQDRDWAGLPDHLKSLPLLITECGLDGLITQGHPPRGWQNLQGPEQYLRQLAWYDAELQKDPYVAGAAVYCLATPDPQWKPYDIWPEPTGMLAKQATPLYRLSEVPPPTKPEQPVALEEPEQPPAGPWRMEVAARPGSKIIAGSFPRAGIHLTITDPWGNAATTTSGSKPEYGVGGFEVLAPHTTIYRLSFLGQTFRVQTREASTIVTFTEVEQPEQPPPEPPQPPEEPPPEGPMEPKDEYALMDRVLERLDRIIESLQARS